MATCIYKSYTKEELNFLDLQSFGGKIHLIDKLEDVDAAVMALQKECVLGFDTETRPSFTKNVRYFPSLLQLSTESDAYLFRLNKVSLPESIIGLFESKNIVKVGVAISRDLSELCELAPFEAHEFVDLNVLAPKKGLLNIGVRNLAASVLGFRVSKRQQISNWEAESLSPAQQKYAATDAWVCHQVYLCLKNEPDIL